MAAFDDFKAHSRLKNILQEYASGGYVEVPYVDHGDYFPPEFLGQTPPSDADALPAGKAYETGGEVEAHQSLGPVGRSFKALRSKIENERGASQARRFDRLGDEVPLDRWSDRALEEVFTGGRRNAPLTTIHPSHFERYANEIPLSVRLESPYSYKDKESPDLASYLTKLGGYAMNGGLSEIPGLNVSSRFPMSSEGLRYPVITGHEGRHRMRALDQMGDRRAPVVLAPWGNPDYITEALSKNGNRILSEGTPDLERMQKRSQDDLDWWLKNMSQKLPNQVFADGGSVYDTGSMFLNSSSGLEDPTASGVRSGLERQAQARRARALEAGQRQDSQPAPFWSKNALTEGWKAAEKHFDAYSEWDPSDDYRNAGTLGRAAQTVGNVGRVLGDAAFGAGADHASAALGILGGGSYADRVARQRHLTEQARRDLHPGLRDLLAVPNTILSNLPTWLVGTAYAAATPPVDSLSELPASYWKSLNSAYDTAGELIEAVPHLFGSMTSTAPRGYAGGGNVNRLRKAAQQARNALLEGDVYNPKKETFLRFGEIPEDERSNNYVRGTQERGVSTYELSPAGAIVHPDLDEYDGPLLRMRDHLGLGDMGGPGEYPHYLVQGRRVGRGEDGEPLLRDLQMLPQTWHRPRTQYGEPGGLSEWYKNVDDDIFSYAERPNFADGGEVEAHKSKGRVGIEFLKGRDWLEPEKREALDKINKVTNSTKNEALIYGAIGDPDGVSDVVRGDARSVALPDWANSYARDAAQHKRPFFSAHTHPNNTLSPSVGDLEAWGRNPTAPEDMLIQAWPRGSVLQIGSTANVSKDTTRRAFAGWNAVNSKNLLDAQPQMFSHLTDFSNAHGIRIPKNESSLQPWWADMEAAPLLSHLTTEGVPIKMSAEHMIPGTKDLAADVYPELLKFLRKPSRASGIPFNFADGGEVRGYRAGDSVVNTIKKIGKKFGSTQAQRAEQAADLTPLERYTDKALMHMFDPEKKSTGLLAAMDPESFQDYALRLPASALFAVPYPRFKNVPAKLRRGMPESEHTLDNYLDFMGNRILDKGIDSANDLAFMPSLWFGRTMDPMTNVVGHEGRHRMMALDRLGDDKALVNLLPGNEGELRGDIEERLERLRAKYFPKGGGQLILPESLGGAWDGGKDADRLGMRVPRPFHADIFAEGGEVEAHKSKGRVGIEFLKGRDWLEPEKREALDRIHKTTNATKNEALIYGIPGIDDPLSTVVRGTRTGVAEPEWAQRFINGATGPNRGEYLPWFSAHTHPNNSLSPSQDDINAWAHPMRAGNPEQMLIQAWPQRSVLQLGSLKEGAPNRTVDRFALGAAARKAKLDSSLAVSDQTLMDFATAHGMSRPTAVTPDWAQAWGADMRSAPFLERLADLNVPIRMSADHKIGGGPDLAADVFPELTKFLKGKYLINFADGGPVAFQSRGHVLEKFVKKAKSLARDDFEPLVDRLREPDGGFTWQPMRNEHASGGYAASIYPERSTGLDLSQLGVDPLYEYFMRNQDVFGNPDHYFGGWHDPKTSRLFLDTSIVRPSEQEIADLARKHDQLSYFDLNNFRSVDVNRDATSGGAVEKHQRKGPVGEAYRAWKNTKAEELKAQIKELNAGRDPSESFISPETSKRLQTVSEPRRIVNPGIYKDPRDLVEDAKRLWIPDPGRDGPMFQLFGHDRNSLDELSQSKRIFDAIDPPELPWNAPSRARGAAVSEQVLTPRNAARMQDALALGLQDPQLRTTRSWYEMGPLWDMMDRFGLPDQMKRGLNTRMGVMSPGSNPKTEINRGFFAHYLAPQGRTEDLSRFGAMPVHGRPDNFPEDMIGLVPHPYMNTAAMPNLRSFEATGKLSSPKHKVPTYVMASDPVWEYGGRPVADAHFTRFFGYPDVRATDRIAGVRKELSNAEYGDMVPWWQKNIADQLDMRPRDAQALMWNLGGPQTGVAYIGAPKLEMISDQIYAASQRLGIPLEEAAYKMLSGESPGFAEGGSVGDDLTSWAQMNFAHGGSVGDDMLDYYPTMFYEDGGPVLGFGSRC